MAGKKITPEKRALFNDIERFAHALLGNEPVVRLSDLDRRVYAEFEGRIKSAGLDAPLRSGRAEWANLLDWVKARMTERGWIHYFGVGANSRLAFLPLCGEVNGVRLVRHGDATMLRDALIGLISDA